VTAAFTTYLEVAGQQVPGVSYRNVSVEIGQRAVSKTWKACGSSFLLFYGRLMSNLLLLAGSVGGFIAMRCTAWFLLPRTLRNFVSTPRRGSQVLRVAKMFNSTLKSPYLGGCLFSK